MLEIAIGIILGCCALGAGICMGIGAIGPGVGEGHAVAHALDSMARQPEMTGTLRTNMILGCAIAETTGIYALVIAILLIFVAPGMLVSTLTNAIKSLGV